MILIFGKSGQVATALQAMADVTALGRADVDLTDPVACAAAIHAHKPSVVINAAAYTAVDKAEEDEANALLVNGDAPTAMAQACAALGIPFVHISTDYVFDGAGGTAFAPDHPTGPLGAYGRTKLAGEQGVKASGAVYGILRTSWVFSETGGNFVKTMLRVGGMRDALTVVGDQIGGPTSADSIAAACLKLADALKAEPSKSGIYHISGGPDVSWADFAREIFTQTGMDVTVTDIPSTEYPTPAKRPLNSRMNCDSLADIGVDRPDWRSDLAIVLKNLETQA